MKFDYSKLPSTGMQQARIKHEVCGKPMLDIKEDNHLMQFTLYGIILDKFLFCDCPTVIYENGKVKLEK